MKKTVKLLSIILCLSLMLVFGAGCNEKGEKTATATNESSQQSSVSPTESGASQKEESKETDIDVKDSYTAVITIRDYGEIELELDGKTAPITVANFVKLAKSGFYNGLTFHRVINGFMIQGGDPLGNGTGGSDEEIKGEFSANGIENNIKHVRGVISMARNGYSMDSASSQFFIMHQDAPHLDGQYAAFGKVTKGMEVVDEIAKNTPVLDNNGTVAAKYQPIITSIEIK